MIFERSIESFLSICHVQYKNSASAVSVGELHQQFSLEENIQMAMYAAEFLRKAKDKLGEHVNVNYVPSGYLTLASDEQADQLYRNSILQNRLGARNTILSQRKLKERFPWLNVEGVEIGESRTTLRVNQPGHLRKYYAFCLQVATVWKTKAGSIHGHC